VEIAVLFPAFLVLLFTGVQAAEWYHVRSLCLAAADAGVRAGRPPAAGPADARAAAAGFLTRVGGSTVAEATVSTVGSTPTLVRVQVSGTVPRVLPIPGLSLRVTQSAHAGKEKFSTPTGVRR
jgi:Flp pilus assembly protein TadG